MERCYKIKSPNYKFVAKVTHRTAFVHPDILIEFGDFNNYCVIVTISSADPQYPNINFVKYNKKCTIRKELEKGGGTVEMLNACLSFVTEAFAKIKIKGFIFKDKSKIKDGRIKLPEYYIFTYGKTWYQGMSDFNSSSEEIKSASPLEVHTDHKLNHTPEGVVNCDSIRYQQKFDAKPFDEKTHSIHNGILEELEQCHNDLMKPWTDKLDYDLFFRRAFDTV